MMAGRQGLIAARVEAAAGFGSAVRVGLVDCYGVLTLMMNPFRSTLATTVSNTIAP